MAHSKKLVDLIVNETKFRFSFEVTPDVNNEDIEKLETDPTFFAITWHAKTHKCRDLDIAPLRTANFLRSKGKQVLLHLSCDLLKQEYLIGLLTFLQEKGICNLFLILGESYNSKGSDFKNTVELIKFIRATTGNYFCIGVAGFCECNEETLLHLKIKTDFGADFIITQAFFEANVYKAFKERCIKIGINVPIIPGMFAFESRKQLINFASMCRVKVSNDLLDYAEKNEGNETVGVEVINKIIQTLRDDYSGVNFHFFTLNKLRNVGNIIKKIND